MKHKVARRIALVVEYVGTAYAGFQLQAGAPTIQAELERAIDLSIEATKFAHDQGMEVVFFPIDFTRSELKWVIDLIERVGNEGHMDGLALVDTMGVTSIHAMTYFVRAVKARLPDVPLEAHFHMDFGLGIANTIVDFDTALDILQHGHGRFPGRSPRFQWILSTGKHFQPGSLPLFLHEVETTWYQVPPGTVLLGQYAASQTDTNDYFPTQPQPSLKSLKAFLGQPL